MFINRQELIFNDHTETRGPQGFRPWRWIIKNARQVFFLTSRKISSSPEEITRRLDFFCVKTLDPVASNRASH
jgi:hypothetical protein